MNALERRCPVCKQGPGEACRTLIGGKTLHEAFGYEHHYIRADGLPYNKEEREG